MGGCCGEHLVLNKQLHDIRSLVLENARRGLLELHTKKHGQATKVSHSVGSTEVFFELANTLCVGTDDIYVIDI